MKVYLRKGYPALLVAIAAVTLAACTPPLTPTPTPSPAPKPAPAPGPSPAAPLPGYVDPQAVSSAEVSFASEVFTIQAYLSRPHTGESLPGLIIIHENRGLTPHIQDVARRFAAQGYAALATDLLSRVGGQLSLPSQMTPWRR